MPDGRPAEATVIPNWEAPLPMVTPDEANDIATGRFFATGLAMGAADAIPGISASTMALILGIYQRLISALDNLLRWCRSLLKSKEDRTEATVQARRALSTLIPVGLGVLSGIIIASFVLVGPDDAPGLMRRSDTGALAYAYIFGLVLASVPTPWLQIEEIQFSHWLLLGASALMLASISLLGINEEPPPMWTIPFAGAIAATAMLIPGISGSLVLLILGHYTIVYSALQDFEIVILGLFSIGLLAGALLSVPTINRTLERHHDAMMAVLTGLILGSLPYIWPWKEQYDIEAGLVVNIGPSGPYIGVAICFLLGVMTIIGANFLESRRWLRG